SSYPVLSTISFYYHTSLSFIYTLSLHDALPIFLLYGVPSFPNVLSWYLFHWMPLAFFHNEQLDLLLLEHLALDEYDQVPFSLNRSEEHTSELQSRFDLVCRLLLEKKKNKIQQYA